MENFNLKSYWQNRYLTQAGSAGSGSGVGSEGQEAMMKATMINHWVRQYNIKTITEVGCGSGTNLLMYTIPTSYTGYDISPEAIRMCCERTKKIHNSLKYYFTTEYQNQDFTADLLLCLDLWFHQVDDQDFEMLCKNVFVDFKGKYIIIYSTDSNCQFTTEGLPMAKHMRPREVMSKIQEYPQWKVLYWISGIGVNVDGKLSNTQFPSDKRFYLLERIPLEIPKE